VTKAFKKFSVSFVVPADLPSENKLAHINSLDVAAALKAAFVVSQLTDMP
jgi:hypothetical protein